MNLLGLTAIATVAIAIVAGAAKYIQDWNSRLVKSALDRDAISRLEK